MHSVLWVFATVLHLFLCLVLIVVILLQQGKGSDIGATFGGGSTQTVFGSRGPANFFHYVTTGSATVFMITSLYLAMYPTNPGAKSVMETGNVTPTVTASPAPAVNIDGGTDGGAEWGGNPEGDAPPPEEPPSIDPPPTE